MISIQHNSLWRGCLRACYKVLHFYTFSTLLADEHLSTCNFYIHVPRNRFCTLTQMTMHLVCILHINSHGKASDLYEVGIVGILAREWIFSLGNFIVCETDCPSKLQNSIFISILLHAQTSLHLF